MKEQFAPEEKNRDTASFKMDNEFNRAINEENIDFNIPRSPLSAVEQSHGANVQNLIQKIENHPHRHALQVIFNNIDNSIPSAKNQKTWFVKLGTLNCVNYSMCNPKHSAKYVCRTGTSASSTARAGTSCEMIRKRTRSTSRSPLDSQSITTSRKGDPTGTVKGRSQGITSTTSRIRSRRMQEETFLGSSQPFIRDEKFRKNMTIGLYWRSDSWDGQIGERGPHTPRYWRRNLCVPQQLEDPFEFCWFWHDDHRYRTHFKEALSSLRRLKTKRIKLITKNGKALLRLWNWQDSWWHSSEYHHDDGPSTDRSGKLAKRWLGQLFVQIYLMQSHSGIW